MHRNKTTLKQAVGLLLALLCIPAFAPSLRAANSFDIYGFTQVDAVQDFQRVNPDWDATLRPSKLPTTPGQYGSDGESIISVRQSRLGAKSNLETDNGDVFTRVEFDFFGTGADAGQTTIRLRHAYGEWNHILAGQTNSLFMDGDIFPNTIDYWGPSGMVFLRNPQIRWTPISGQTSLAVAMESPNADINAGKAGQEIEGQFGTNVQTDNRIPDFTVQMRQEGDLGHIQLGSVFRRLGYDAAGTPGNRPSGSVFGWGLDLTSNLKVGAKDMLHGGIVYGEGIGNYMNDGGYDLAPKTDGTSVVAEAAPLMGYMMYYDHWWNAKWSSSAGFSSTQVDNTDLNNPTDFHHGQYSSANLLYYPTKNVFMGGEFLWGQLNTAAGSIGTDKRFQFSINYKFSSGDILGKS